MTVRTRRLLQGITIVAAPLLLTMVGLSAMGREQPPPIPPGITALAIETQTRECGGGPGNEDVLAMFRVPNGDRVWDVFPGLLDSPELNRADTELTVLVYRDGYPGILFMAPHAARLGAGDREPDPGTVDICVETVDGSSARSLTSSTSRFSLGALGASWRRLVLGDLPPLGRDEPP